MTQEQNSPNNAPVARIRCESITVGIWENAGQYGPMHAIHVQRSYLDANGQWQNTTSVPTNQILAAAKAMELAYTWIARRREQLRTASAPAPKPAVAKPQPVAPAGHDPDNYAEPTDPRRRPTEPDPNDSGEFRTIKLSNGTTHRVSVDVAAEIEAQRDLNNEINESASRQRTAA